MEIYPVWQNLRIAKGLRAAANWLTTPRLPGLTLIFNRLTMDAILPS